MMTLSENAGISSAKRMLRLVGARRHAKQTGYDDPQCSPDKKSYKEEYHFPLLLRNIILRENLILHQYRLFSFFIQAWWKDYFEQRVPGGTCYGNIRAKASSSTNMEGIGL
jgi:hypothetical protein